jgi:hypothetical protein
MDLRLKMTAVLASLGVLTIALRCLWLWQPDRQVILHQARLRGAIESRDWASVQTLIDPAYTDRWGYTRDTGIRDARQWLGQFFALTIIVQPIAHQSSPTAGTVTECWKLDGTGTEMAAMVKDSVNTLQSPFTFRWQHTTWKPWHWTLLRVDNPALQLPAPDT